MQPKKDFSESFNRFVTIQNEHKLADIQVDGVYLWRLIRAQLFVQALENKDVILKTESKNTSLSKQITLVLGRLLKFISSPAQWKRLPKFAAKLKTLAIDIINIIPSLLFTSKLMLLGTKKSVLISAFIRNIGVGHKLTQPAEEKHRNDHILLDKPSAGLFSPNRLDTRAFNIIARRIFRARIMDDLKPAVAQIANAYGLEPAAVNRLATKHLITFKTHESAFLHFFKKSKFQEIYLCWNRYYMPLLSAANKSGIKTSEFQHGTITPYHIMYAWEGYDDVPYSPDRLLCFGPSWPEESNLSKSINSEILGAPHLEKCRVKFASQKAADNQVIIFSQNVIGLKLLDFSIKVARLRPDLRFTFKPHPAEHYLDISQYIDGKIPDNFELASPDDDSYKLMAGASYQIGVSSTTLNEGMVFGNRVIIIPFSSWEYLDSAIKLGHATLATTPEEAAKLLEPATPVCDNPETYYAPVDLNNL